MPVARKIKAFLDEHRVRTEDEEIVFEAGNHKEAIKIAYSDFAELARPIVADYAAT